MMVVVLGALGLLLGFVAAGLWLAFVYQPFEERDTEGAYDGSCTSSCLSVLIPLALVAAGVIDGGYFGWTR